jgi:integrase
MATPVEDVETTQERAEERETWTLEPSMAPATRLDVAIAAWLDETGKRSGSAETLRAYRSTLASFRTVCRGLGLDLDTLDRLEEAERKLLVQGWAGQPQGRGSRGSGRPGVETVAAATFNRRLAILSSFYASARGLLGIDSPAAVVKRRPVQGYAGAVPLSAASVAERLAAIDRQTPAGARDYALLVVALQTGRRASELAGLRWGDVRSDEGRLTLTWQRTKGGKTMRDTLPAAVGQALLAWLHVAYGGADVDLDALAPVSPIWRSLARNGSRGQALGVQSVADIWAKRLRTSKVHSTRHTFARTMELLGAKVSDIQARLGHASLQTTGRYLAALGSAENQHGDALAALFGVTSTS